MRTTMLLTILAAGVMGIANAAPIPMSPELRAFLERPDQQKSALGMMSQQWRLVIENCPKFQLQQANVVIDTLPIFDANGVPISGEWKVVSRVEGCGVNRFLTVQYLFTPDGKMVRVALLPGTTAADLRLQKDALTYASIGMSKLAPKGCADVQYTDTKFVGFGEPSPTARPDRENRSWTEEWTVRECGVTGVVTMHFVPDQSGTSIQSDADSARQISP